jgi:lysophospholipase L1-like esterase
MNNNRRPPVAALQCARHWWLKLAVLIFLLVAQEFIYRPIFPLPEVTGFNRIHYQLLAADDSRTRPIRQRGLAYDRLRFQSQPDGFSFIHRLNLYGFRGDDFTIAPPRRRRRILFVGDSVVEGQGAPESATISAVFSRLLQRDGKPADIINLGVVAASLNELTPLARDSVAVLKPTDVVLVLFANDLPAPRYQDAFDQRAPILRSRSRLARPRVLELLMRLVYDQPIYRRWPPHPVLPFFLPVPDSTNPWTGAIERPIELDRNLYKAMIGGKVNPWLWHQAKAIPAMLSHDFLEGDGSPAAHLKAIARWCKVGNAHLVVSYVPFCGVTSERYAPSLVKMGMEQSIAQALVSDPIYRRQNDLLVRLTRDQNLPFADTTEALKQAEAEGIPQYWNFDTHPRPSGYATIARRIYDVWQHARQQDAAQWSGDGR